MELQKLTACGALSGKFLKPGSSRGRPLVSVFNPEVLANVKHSKEKFAV